MIDVIDDKTLYYSQNGGEAVGGFTWSLHFTWHQTFDRELKRRAIEKGSDYIRLVERTSKMVAQMVILYLFYPELLGWLFGARYYLTNLLPEATDSRSLNYWNDYI